MYSSSDGYFQQDNAPCHKARIISNWFLEHDSEFSVPNHLGECIYIFLFNFFHLYYFFKVKKYIFIISLLFIIALFYATLNV